MDDPESTGAQRIAQAAMNFEQRLTGKRPSSVALVISDDMLVITLRGADSRAEIALGRSPDGAARRHRGAGALAGRQRPRGHLEWT